MTTALTISEEPFSVAYVLWQALLSWWRAQDLKQAAAPGLLQALNKPNIFPIVPTNVTHNKSLFASILDASAYDNLYGQQNRVL